MISDEKTLTKMMSEAVALLSSQFPDIESLLFKLLDKGEVGLFGGYVRDLAISGDFTNFRDLDLVVSALSNEDLVLALQPLDFQRTRFGGFRFAINNIKIDLWALNATWAYRKGFMAPTFNNLPRSTFLTIDAIVVTLRDLQLYEYRFFESIKKRSIDIALKENPFPVLCVLRSLVLRRKYDYSFSDALRNYIKVFWESSSNPLEELNKMQLSHYGSPMITNADILHDIKEYIYQD